MPINASELLQNAGTQAGPTPAQRRVQAQKAKEAAAAKARQDELAALQATVAKGRAKEQRQAGLRKRTALPTPGLVIEGAAEGRPPRSIRSATEAAPAPPPTATAPRPAGMAQRLQNVAASKAAGSRFDRAGQIERALQGAR